MPSTSIQLYEFENFRLSITQKVLLRDGKPVPLTPKVFDTLVLFLENSGRLLEKNELLLRIWQDHFVDEGNLASNIKVLRKALGDDAGKPRFIETVPRRGYRFIAEVRTAIENNSSNGDRARAFSQAEGQSFVDLFRHFLLPGVCVFIIGITFVGFWLAMRNFQRPVAPILSAPFNAEKLSTDGKVLSAIISPDGKNVFYTDKSGDNKQSVWLRQLESAVNVQIIPSSDDIYYGLAVSPDSNFLYFVRRPKSYEGQGDIYRVSIFGGIPVKIVSETQGSVDVSADGERIAFRRCYYRDDDFCSLWIADALDGRNEIKLASRPRPTRIGDSRFSPDGRSVAFTVGQSENAATEFGLAEVDVASGAEHFLTAQKFFDIKHFAWLPDGGGLFLTASQIPNKGFRIWQVSRATGEAQPLTNDSESYSVMSLDKTASRLISTQVKQDFRLQLFDLENLAVPKVLADATHITFAPNGKIVFSSWMTGNDEIWSVNLDGSGKQQLTNNAADDRFPVVSADNNYVFFSSNRTGESHIWRMNMDGSNQIQITHKDGGFPLSVSADGKRVYYHHGLSRTLWWVSTAGGDEQLVFGKREDYFGVSPDGAQVAFFNDQQDRKALSVMRIDDKSIVKTFYLPDRSAKVLDIAWLPDGTGITYILAHSDDENNALWVQSIDSLTPKLLTELGGDEINSLAFSPDRKHFAIAQGGWKHDAVLITGLK